MSIRARIKSTAKKDGSILSEVTTERPINLKVRGVSVDLYQFRFKVTPKGPIWLSSVRLGDEWVDAREVEHGNSQAKPFLTRSFTPAIKESAKEVGPWKG